MIDTHCHIDFEEYDEDRDQIIKRAEEVLDAVVVSGIGYESNRGVLDLCSKYENFIYPSLGYHPVSSQNCTEEELKLTHQDIIENRDNIVAIGEVGMDYFYVKDKALREKQREIFQTFIELADEYKIPLLMHVRDCEKKALNMVLEYENIPYVVFHCFSGSKKTAKRIIQNDNYFMSFSTMLCYSTQHQELIKNIPLDNILTETDSPYLAMTKEERNEPANVVNAVKKIAEIQNEDVETVDSITTANARRIFKI
ncbi:TatD family hydrolase [Methanobrevibacter millerae]|uniref:TatD DNase family protein n=1 Tax=Methanobrevibacter millerae TaxID=230361 RepID=A0A1G5V344_9EURY|nr:TatD family hydrolase [Methanobrevibacter millerae]SDA39415.1 TatD DNase family protein [Methanobrevibacter millerae]